MKTVLKTAKGRVLERLRRRAEGVDFLSFVHQERVRLIMQLPLKGRILDCGGAAYPLCIDYPHKAEIICINTPDENYYGHDFVLLNERYKGRETFMPGDAENMDFPDESFDMVFAGQLIEHLPGPERFLSEAHRVLRVGGVIVIDTPNRIVTDIINHVVRRHTKDDTWFHGKEVGHIREFYPRELTNLVGKYRFRIGRKSGIYADIGAYAFRKHWPSRGFYVSKLLREFYAYSGRYLHTLSYLFWLEAEKVAEPHDWS